MSPEALSELISNIAHNLVAAGQAGELTDELIPPIDKLAVMRPKDRAHGDHARTGANERLADKAEMAKAAAEELRKNAHEVPDRERAFNRERAQGR